MSAKAMQEEVVEAVVLQARASPYVSLRLRLSRTDLSHCSAARTAIGLQHVRVRVRASIIIMLAEEEAAVPVHASS